MLFVSILPFRLLGETRTDIETGVPTIEVAETGKSLSERVIEIQNMDKSNLTSAEKKSLRKELKGIKSELAETNTAAKAAKNGGGIYISVGGLIIIILLLIIIL